MDIKLIRKTWITITISIALIIIIFLTWQNKNALVSKIQSENKSVEQTKSTASNADKVAANKPIPNIKKSLLNTTSDDKNSAQSSHYIAECTDLDKLAINESLNEIDNELLIDSDKFVEALKQSTKLESEIAHALINNSVTELQSLQEQNPNNKFISYNLISACLTAKAECEARLFADARSLDEQNGAVWFLSALNELKNSNTEKFTEFLIEASNAPIYEEYWRDYFSLFESAYSHVGVGNSPQTQIATLGYIAAFSLPAYKPLVDFCESIELERLEVLDACSNIGQRFTSNSSNILSSYIGLAIQQKVAERYNDDKRLVQIEHTKHEYDKMMGLSGKAMSLTLQSRKRTSEWLQQYKSLGEFASTQYVIEEAIKLSADPDFDPCEFDW
ncbi:hypothetical protein D5R81_04375 [Parashewanella spongiae]|uniref:Uncharacterized protein n=1 Tax=Parashewanella spongiae TaxID=342950 RepID=A0A3A6U3K2_9GAMM|nr:hypothetical protein [Parashewanella spongiae]MCL1077508.1 hypothetical protein [Parashewanella spongiae]RJY18635.1 hypothetical protein D5R81_04375 [Parashewanella spongiae]